MRWWWHDVHFSGPTTSTKERASSVKSDLPRWIEVTRSRFEHERDGLAHVRDQLPECDPYVAWSNFEFIAADGKHHEIDLLVLGPAGLHLVELKAWSGKITGDERDWWEHNPGAGHPIRRRNPLGLTRAKAQSFRSWLEAHARRLKVRVQIPYVHESLFLHGIEVDCQVPTHVRERIFGLEEAKGNGLRRIVADRIAMQPERGVPLAGKAAQGVAALIAAAGLTRQPKELRVGEWVLDEGPYDEGWGWQDHLARHGASDP